MIRLGTRGSELARTQSEDVARRLAAAGHEIEIHEIRTVGDRDQRSRFSEVGTAGIFVREIETALLEDRIDIAVHSYKDLPSMSPEDLVIAAIPDPNVRRLRLTDVQALFSDGRRPLGRDMRSGCQRGFRRPRIDGDHRHRHSGLQPPMDELSGSAEEVDHPSGTMQHRRQPLVQRPLIAEQRMQPHLLGRGAHVDRAATRSQSCQR